MIEAKALQTIVVLLVVLCSMSATQIRAQRIELPGGEWEGTYYYDTVFPGEVEPRSPVDFVVDLRVFGDSFAGTIKERATFGRDQSRFLFAEMLGRVNSDRTFMFMKRYDGTAGVTHSVYYVGKLDVHRMRVEGRWWLDKLSGPFDMRPRRSR